MNDILELAATCRIFSTDHAGRLFKDVTRPNQRALERLNPLVERRILETKEKVTGKHRGLSTHLFRLTKKGREQMNVTYHPIPFTNSRVPHWLELTSVYMDMCEIEKPFVYIPEQRLEGLKDGKLFTPDIFVVWIGRAFYIEVQKSPLNSKQWALKWIKYNEWFKDKLYHREKWQTFEKPVKPSVVAVSNQMYETVGNGTDTGLYKFYQVQDIRHLPNVL